MLSINVHCNCSFVVLRSGRPRKTFEVFVVADLLVKICNKGAAILKPHLSLFGTVGVAHSLSKMVFCLKLVVAKTSILWAARLSCENAFVHLLMNPDHTRKGRSVWPTLPVKIARRKVGANRHFQAS